MDKEKLDRIKDEIGNSLELTRVDHIKDTLEFEDYTNRQFNKSIGISKSKKIDLRYKNNRSLL